MYVEMWDASLNALKSGQSVQVANSVAAKWQFLACAVLTSFSLEAYLNHIGALLLKCWISDLEKLPPAGKMALIWEKLEIQPGSDAGSRPIQTILNLIRFRNTMAHGKTEQLKPKDQLIDVNDSFYSLIVEPILSDWEILVKNENFCIQAREDVQSVLKQIHAVQAVDSSALFTPGRRQGTGRKLSAP